MPGRASGRLRKRAADGRSGELARHLRGGPRPGVERLRRGLVVEVPPGRSASGQGERLEAVLLAHPVDGLAERHLAPAVVQGELERVVREPADAHPDQAHPAGADVELVADGLELGARLAYYSTRATERELGPTPRAPFTLLGVERFALDDEGTPDAVTAVATVRWSDVVPALHDGTDTDVVVDDLGFHVKRSSSALSSTLVCRGRAWRVLTSGGVDGATTLLVERSLEALRDGYVGEERARFDRLRRGIADAARAELARPPVWPTGRRWRYRMSTQTIEGEGPIGQITELLVPGVGRVWVREALDLGDGFTTSSNQRWGWKHGDIGRDRQVLQLAAPWWAWSAVAEVVGEIDPLHRRVVHHARWTQDEGRHLADFLPADQRGGTWSSSTTSRVSVWLLVN